MDNSFDWSRYPLMESNTTEEAKCKALIRISEQMLGAIEVDNPTQRDIDLAIKHTTIIKRNKAKLLLMGVKQ